MRSLTLFGLCGVAALVGACSFNWDTFQGPRGDTDVPSVTDADDASMDSPEVVDTAPECTPASDTCPVGRYCAPGLNQCVSGCRNDGDCAGLSDGGATELHCNTSTHACVPCVADTHCPLGQLCMSNACVEGCNPGHACPSGRTCCSGGCIDTQSSTGNCGACGSTCSVANGTPTCIGGACGIESCRAGFGDCDRSAGNGCETDLTTSLTHCGMCGMACAPPPHAAATCVAGRCGMGACETGYADCDGNPANGCEVNLRADTSNCGTCGTVCLFPGAGAACSLGTCVRTMCTLGMGDCDGNASDCEVTFATSVTNCGRCGNACSFAHAAAVCTAGVCGFTRCDTGWGDCDGNPMNGCETDLTSSASNCGVCGTVCVFPGGTGVCRGGVCALASCETGRDNCDGVAMNGCEVDIRSNLMNCGTCGVPCATRPNSAPYCSSSVCGMTCSTGFENCDRLEANGCETDIRTSVANCGSCGGLCSPPGATGACSGGVCTVATCRAGLGNCDSIDSNGCETDTTSSLANCGMCGRACSTLNTTNTCASGNCRVTQCLGSYGNCDSNDQNGCETNLINSNANCGACGTVCGSGRTCVNGRCSVASFAGYSVVNNPSGLAWIDACAEPGHATTLSGADDDFVVGTLPFPVSLYGGLNDEYLINANGFLGLGTLFFNLFRTDGTNTYPATGSLSSWGTLPTTTAPFPGAYVLGIDLLAGATGVCVATVGTAPNRTWVVEWLNARSFAGTLGATSYTFEFAAYEASQNLDIVYNNIVPPAAFPLNAPDLVTVGIQDHRTASGVRANAFTGTIATGTRVRFQPLP